jgi:hypothetical protein
MNYEYHVIGAKTTNVEKHKCVNKILAFPMVFDALE